MNNLGMGMTVSQLTGKTIETKYGRIFLHENGIIYFYMLDNLSIDIAVAKQMVMDAHTLDNSGKIRQLFIPGEGIDLTFEAQHYFSSASGFTHVAMVAQSRLQAEVGQFLVTMMRALHSSYELRLFHQVDQAETWLLSV